MDIRNLERAELLGKELKQLAKCLKVLEDGGVIRVCAKNGRGIVENDASRMALKKSIEDRIDIVKKEIAEL